MYSKCLPLLKKDSDRKGKKVVKISELSSHVYLLTIRKKLAKIQNDS